jgi:hypothetical protein
VPILGYLADTINFIVTRHFGFNDIEFVWEQDRTLNPLEQAKIDKPMLDDILRRYNLKLPKP